MKTKLKRKAFILNGKYLYIIFIYLYNAKNDKFVAATSLLDQSLLNKSINFKVWFFTFYWIFYLILSYFVLPVIQIGERKRKRGTGNVHKQNSNSCWLYFSSTARPTGISLFYLTLPLLSKGSSHAGVRAEAETTSPQSRRNRSKCLPACCRQGTLHTRTTYWNQNHLNKKTQWCWVHTLIVVCLITHSKMLASENICLRHISRSH